MTATERARRSDSLYYDTSVINRRALCDMVANLESDIEESKAENAKLRDLLTCGELVAYAYAMYAENAKLRELLQRALTSHNKMCTNRGTCLGCLLFNAKPFAPVCSIISVTRDARELGIEAEP